MTLRLLCRLLGESLRYTPNPTTAAKAAQFVEEILPKLEAQERELREQIEAERVAASRAEAHDARERCANARSAAQLIDMVEAHGRHVPVIVTEDAQLGVRGLRELDPVIRYAMTGHAEAIKTLLRERQAVLLIA